jgi:hypothetical protein
MWKETAMAYFTIIFWYCLEETRKSMRFCRTGGNGAIFWARSLLKTKWDLLSIETNHSVSCGFKDEKMEILNEILLFTCI